jgi:hypothetical protein
VLYVSWAEDAEDLLSHAVDVPRRWEGYLMFVGQNTPAEALSSMARLRVQDPSRLQFVTARGFDQARAFLKAFVQRLDHGSDSERILHAWWQGNSLEILTTRFQRLTVPHASIPPLAEVGEEECRNLDVAYDGSYIAWPAVDVHIGFEQFEEWVSPEKANRRRQQNTAYNARYGAAIRSIRKAHHLAQSQIPGLSARHVGRIENGVVRATRKALGILARAHSLSEADYVAAIAAAMEAA